MINVVYRTYKKLTVFSSTQIVTTMLEFGIDRFAVEDMMELVNERSDIRLSVTAESQVKTCRNYVESILDKERPIYGVNTGFGPLCDVRIPTDDINQLQENLLLSHAVGVGENISKALSRLMLLTKIHSLAKGHSGVRLELLERLMYFNNHDLIPAVPEQGSVGASGDLAPLSHLFLPLIGHGEFLVDGGTIPAKEKLKEHQLDPFQLQAKEGLALINGTQFILAHAIIGLDRMSYLLDLADLAGAMSLEAFQGSASTMHPKVHELRPFNGTIHVASRMRHYLKDSQNLQSHFDCDRVQDPYSIRCIPQVHGASRNAYNHLKELTEIELNAVTDNPIILNADEAISGGNFHGQPLAMALDYCCLASAELGNISDRRSYLLLEGKYGLPKLLTKEGGLNSGFMIPQYTTAALVSENKSLCFPASADSIPTSLGQEDHVSMGSISGRRFNQILNNLEKIIAIELMYAAQGLSYRRPNTFSKTVERAHALIRTKVQPIEKDRLLKNDIDEMISLVQNRSFEFE